MEKLKKRLADSILVERGEEFDVSRGEAEGVEGGRE